MLSEVVGHNVTSIERIGGGGNSRVYKITCGRSGSYAAKFYFRQDCDERNRLEVEYSTLLFLWESGFRSVPRPILADKANGLAIFEYIAGNKMTAQEITGFDIDYAAEFLLQLKDLKGAKQAGFFPVASEACFSVGAVVENIELRLNKLFAVPKRGEMYQRLHRLLVSTLVPSFEEIAKWCRSSLAKSGLSFTSSLGAGLRTLSPSDFGFHNAVKRRSGEIVFLDFEYFGWDDPAKMISDFLLHPAMQLREGQKRRFLSKMLAGFREQKSLPKRLEAVYPLFGLKWCLILLNEFVPEDLMRRRFAGGGVFNPDRLLGAQLLKAERMLSRIRRHYKHFPYKDQISES